MPALRRLLPLLLALAGLAALAVWRPWASPPRTVVLISIDTLRPDRLGVYGNDPQVSPRIDALAASSVVFDQALAPSPWTLPSHMSMLTGLDPMAHGVWRKGNELSTRVETLAELLRREGFRTAAFTDGGFVSKFFGFGQGFEIYRDTRDTAGGPNGFRRLLPEALQWMRRTRTEDSFVFLHTFDVHAPFQDGDPELLETFRALPTRAGPRDHLLKRLVYFEQQAAMRVHEYPSLDALARDYDAGVHEADLGVGRVLDLLAETGRLENALVIITSDHGESFLEQGLHVGHGIGLTDDEIAIPLIMKLPGAEGAGRRLDAAIDLTDIAPTVLELFGIAAPEVMTGESLLGLLRGRARRRAYVMGMSQNTESFFLVKDGLKFISPPAMEALEIARRHLQPVTPPAPWLGDPDEIVRDEKGWPIYDRLADPLGLRDLIPSWPRLHDRATDPGEQVNLFAARRETGERYAKLLRELAQASLDLRDSLDDHSAARPFDPHIEQQLGQLGYIAAASTDSTAARSELSKLPIDLRIPLQSLWTPPDMSLVDQADRERAILEQRVDIDRAKPEWVEHEIRKIGDKYVAWASEHIEHFARVGWRVEQLVRLGRRVGVPVDLERWSRMLGEYRLKAERAAAPVDDAPGGDPTEGGEAAAGAVPDEGAKGDP